MPNEFQHQIELINARLSRITQGENPAELYEPIQYTLSLGGKRMRPLLVLLGYSLFKENPEKILDQAISVEVFHNFTLMHDDIMDNAPLRRGKASVHEKWDSNIAILSGDVMLVKAYELLLGADSGNLKTIFKAFNQCAIGVCEGQQLDMNFESIASVTEQDYLHMIQMKTAVLLGYSLQLGAMLAEATDEEVESLYTFGCQVGIGFQLMDDLLDVYGNQEKFGKQVGGDIIANKKTYLLIKALELANEDQKHRLQHWLGTVSFNKMDKVEAVTAIYDEIGIRKLTEAKMDEYFKSGFDSLEALSISQKRKQPLIDFTKHLMNREN